MQISHYSVKTEALKTNEHKQRLYSWTTAIKTTISQNESCREDERRRQTPPYVPYHVNTLGPIGKAGKIHSTLGDPTTLESTATATTVAMSSSIPQSCLRQFSRTSFRQGALPTFLTPAFSLPQRTQCFSTTAPAQSRVGGAAISVPPEVSLNFIDLPQTQVRGRTKEIPKTAIEVKGPLGALSRVSLVPGSRGTGISSNF